MPTGVDQYLHCGFRLYQIEECSVGDKKKNIHAHNTHTPKGQRPFEMASVRFLIDSDATDFKVMFSLLRDSCLGQVWIGCRSLKHIPCSILYFLIKPHVKVFQPSWCPNP